MLTMTMPSVGFAEKRLARQYMCTRYTGIGLPYVVVPVETTNINLPHINIYYNYYTYYALKVARGAQQQSRG
jgi:hypothetical protein